MKVIWSKELRNTEGASNKFYRLEIYSETGIRDVEYVVRACWGGIGKKGSMQEKGKYPALATAQREAEILARKKLTSKGYRVYKTKKPEKKKRTEGMSLQQMSRSRFSRLVK